MNIGILGENLKLKFWVIPTLIVLMLFGLYMLSLDVQNSEVKGFLNGFFFREYSPEGARLILSTMGTSLMTVIGVLCSLTILLLQQVSNQYSPRVMESFIRSISTQLMLGFYIGTFLLCLLILRQLPTADSTIQIIQAPITLAIILAGICTAFLIHYVDHLVYSIKSTSIISSIREEGLKYICRYERFVKSHFYQETMAPENFQFSQDIITERPGYFQSFNPEKFCNHSHNEEITIRFARRPGDYLHKGDLISKMHSQIPISDKNINSFKKCILIGETRTHVQDTRFAIRQLVDIALRALSPGINDPSTAVESLNSIGCILQHVKEAGEVTGQIKVKHAVIHIPTVHFNELVDLGFSQIIQVSKNHLPVMHKIRELHGLLEIEENIVFTVDNQFCTTHLTSSTSMPS